MFFFRKWSLPRDLWHDLDLGQKMGLTLHDVRHLHATHLSLTLTHTIRIVEL